MLDEVNVNTNFMFEGCNNLRELRLDYCSTQTINYIISSYNFPTGMTDKYERRVIYYKKADISELELPDGWKFVYAGE